MELTADTFNSMQKFITPNLLSKASSMLGLPADKTKSALMTAIPSIYEALTQRAANPEQAKKVMNIIREGGYDSMSGEGPQPIETQASAGQNDLSRLLDGKADALIGKIASTTGVNASAAGKITGLASTAVFAFLGSKMKASNWSPDVFSSLMSGSAASAIPGNATTWIWIAVVALVAAVVWWLSATRMNTVPMTVERSVSEVVVAPQAEAPTLVINEITAFLANPSGAAMQTFTLRGLAFATGSAELGAEAEQLMDGLPKTLANYPNARVIVEGHTDNLGDAAVNQQLSMQRAQAVRANLIARGVSADRIEATGLGGSQPVGDNSTEAGRQQNRRTDLVITR